ncbi:MAG: DMT family transporter [Rhizobiaceae bacterium]|nr:DMT family transporter [Rhizobiaceae bacterium]
MLLLTLSWGVHGVAAKLGSSGYSPLFLSFARSVISGVIVLAWCRWRGIDLFRRDGTLRAGLLVGVLFSLEFVFIYVGLDYTSVARNTLLLNTMPFFVLIAAHFMLGERITVVKFLGLLLAFAGVALVLSDQLSLPGPGAWIGDLLSLGGGALWAATTIVIKSSRLTEVPPEKLLLYQLGVASVVTLPLLPLGGPVLREASWLATGALAFQALYIVCFTYILWFWMIGRYPAAGLTSFTFLTPIFGVMCAALLLSEPLTIRIVIALLLVVAGLVLVNRPSQQSKRSQADAQPS